MRQPNPISKHESRAAYGLVAPTFILMLLLLVLPTIAVFALSLTDAELGSTSFTFLGLDAYRDLLADRSFLRAFKNTFVYVGMVAPASLEPITSPTSGQHQVTKFKFKGVPSGFLTLLYQP